MIAVDSSILLDVLCAGIDCDASEGALRLALGQGPVVVCDVVLAEVCSSMPNSSDVIAVIRDMGIIYCAIEEKAAIRASEMQRKFRQRGGTRAQRTVADFLIGSHAMLQCNGLISRDHGFFRDYFKGLNVIYPNSAGLKPLPQ